MPPDLALRNGARAVGPARWEASGRRQLRGLPTWGDATPTSRSPQGLPIPAPMEETSSAPFVRHAPSHWWWLAATSYGGVIGLAIWCARNQTLPSIRSILLFALTAIVIGALSGIAERLFPWVQTRGGTLRAFDSWGRRVEILLSEIGEVREFRFWPWAWARVVPREGGSSLWIHLFLADPEPLLDAVRSCTEPGHPLRRFLEERTV